MNEEGVSSALREEESTSLLFPGGSDSWDEVALTFSTGKLEPNCASRQLGEDLYKIPEILLKTEYESRKRLQRTLSSCTILELSMWENPEVGLTKVALKSLLTSLRLDLAAFAQARRLCRIKALTPAQTRHDPDRLIKGSIWGKDLFPTALVASIISDAEKAGKNLCDKWKINFRVKRKLDDSRGPQPKNLGYKRARLFQNQLAKLSKAHFQTLMMSMAPQNSNPSTQANNIPSPAYNPYFENQSFQSARYNSDSGSEGRGSRQERED